MKFSLIFFHCFGLAVFLLLTRSAAGVSGPSDEFFESIRAEAARADGSPKPAGISTPSMMRKYGDWSFSGVGAPRNYAAARNWYAKAALGGDARAMNELGIIYLTSVRDKQSI